MATLDTLIGPTCEPDKLIVEIVGDVANNYTKQRLVIYNEKGQYDEAKTGRLKREQALTDNALTSTLHTWSWGSRDKGRLYLEIAVTRGSPIRLPLMDNAETTPRQRGIHHQNNLIVPVVPMTTIKRPDRMSFKPEYVKITGVPVLCRAGWLYIFYRGRLWREVQIQQDQTTGKTTYHDTRLEFDESGSLREVDGHQRQAVGVALTEIWLPARWNKRQQSIQVFYSEAQLTALRLNYLQAHPDALAKRSHAVAMTPQSISPTRDSAKRYPNQPFLLKTPFGCVSDHIPRNITTERYLNDPTAFLLDVTGNYLTQEFNKAAEKLRDLDRDEYQPLSDIELGPPPDQFAQKVSLNAYSYRLKEILLGKAQGSGDGDNDVLAAKYQLTKDEDDAIWQRKPLTTPVLAAALDKAVCGLYVADPIFDIRYSEQQIHDAQALQKLIAERASLRKQHGNAVLVNNLMYASRHIDEENPLYQATKQLSRRGWSKVSFALAERQRAGLNHYLTQCQNNAYEILQCEQTVEACKDLTSLCGIDYVANCGYLLQVINLIAEPAELTDPLSDAMYKKPEPTQGYELLTGLFNREANSPYYGLLFDADYNPVELLNDYQAPENTPPRSGDGSWYPYEIARLLGQSDSVLTPANAMSLQGAYFAVRFAAGVETFLTVAGKLAAGLYSYIDILEATIKKGLMDIERMSNSGVERETSLLEEEQRKLSGLKQEEARIKAAQQALQTKQSELDRAINANQTQIRVAEARLMTELETAYHIDLATRRENQRYRAYAERWGDKTPATISNQQILGWQVESNPAANRAQQTVMKIEKVKQELAELRIQHQSAVLQLRAKTDELAAKNGQIAEVKAKIERVQQSPAANKRLRVSLTQRHQFISAQTARELLDQEIGLRLDETGKPLPAERMVLGADPQAVSVNGTSVMDIMESNRQKLHRATAAIIKVENGVVIAPRGVSPKKAAQAAAQGKSVLVTGYTWTVAGNKKFWRAYKRELAKLRPTLNQLIAEANGAAAQQTAFLRTVEQVEADIAAKNQQLDELEANRQRELNADYENKQTAANSAEEWQQQRAQADDDVKDTTRELNERDRTDHAQQQEQQHNQRDLEQLEQNRQANSAQQAHGQQTVDGHQNAIEAHRAAGAAAAEDLAAINSRSGFRALDNLATQDGRLRSLNAVRNKLDSLGPLLPAFIVALEIRNIVMVHNENIREVGVARHRVNQASAILNTSAAFDLLGAKLILDQKSRYHQIMNARAKTAPPLPKPVRDRLGIDFISRRLWLQGIAAGAGVVLSAWDLYKAVGSRDPAKIAGYSAITAGSTAILVSTFLSGGMEGAALLGLTAGWWLALGFALFAAGYFIISAFSYTPFEEWIKHGPFADSSNGGILSRTQYPHLESPDSEQEAFYRLVSLIAAVQIEFSEVDDSQWALLQTDYDKPARAVCLSIRTSLPGLLNNPAAYTTVADVRLGYKGAPSFDDGIVVDSYFQQNTPDGVNLYFDQLADAKKACEANRAREEASLRRYGYKGDIPARTGWSVVCAYGLRLQIRVLDKQGKQWVYPAPLPLDNTQFEPDKHGQLPKLYHFDPEPFWLKKHDKFRRVGESNDTH